MGHSRREGARNRSPAPINQLIFLRGFTLIELLIVIAITALLLGILLPAMSAARAEGRAAVCAAKLRELGAGLHLYANDFDGMLMPLAYWTPETIGTGPVIYWWGTNEPTGVSHERGFLWPFLGEAVRVGLFECPEQPWNSYQSQGASQSLTSTYGYNGYYLSPPHTPGWGFTIGHMPWLSTSRVRDTGRVFAFADALLDLGGALPWNNALLDPPLLYAGGGQWSSNGNPTTAFRHAGRAEAVHVDGHAEAYRVQAGWLTSQRFAIGSVGATNAPHYVPNWREWTGP